MDNELKLSLGKTMVVDAVIFKFSVRTCFEWKINGVQNQQSYFLIRKIQIIAIADFWSSNCSCRQPVRLNKILPFRTGNCFTAIRSIVSTEIGIVIVIADHEQYREPRTAQCFRTQSSFAATLYFRAIAIAHITDVKQKPCVA